MSLNMLEVLIALRRALEDGRGKHGYGSAVITLFTALRIAEGEVSGTAE